MFHLIALPFKIVFGLLFLFLVLPFAFLIVPFLLIRFVVRALVLLVALPFALMAIVAAFLVAFLAIVCVLMIPLLPFAFVALCVWAIVRSSRPAVAVIGIERPFALTGPGTSLWRRKDASTWLI